MVLEVTVAFVLGLAAASLVRELMRLEQVDAGIAIENVATLHLTPRAPAADYYAIEARVSSLCSVRDVNPRLAIFDVKTMAQVVDESLWELSLHRRLIGLFAVVAGGLAAIGLFGVIAYTTASRRREFAIRLALGSGQSALACRVFGRGAVLALGGLGCGVVVVLILRWWFPAATAAVRPDLTAFSIVAMTLGGITLLACALPALRAARVSPALPLRQE